MWSNTTALKQILHSRRFRFYSNKFGDVLIQLCHFDAAVFGDFKLFVITLTLTSLRKRNIYLMQVLSSVKTAEICKLDHFKFSFRQLSNPSIHSPTLNPYIGWWGELEPLPAHIGKESLHAGHVGSHIHFLKSFSQNFIN